MKHRKLRWGAVAVTALTLAIYSPIAMTSATSSVTSGTDPMKELKAAQYYESIFGDDVSDEKRRTREQNQTNSIRDCYRNSGIPTTSNEQDFVPLTPAQQKAELACFNTVLGEEMRVQDAVSPFIRDFAIEVMAELDTSAVKSEQDKYVSCMSSKGVKISAHGSPTAYERSSLSAAEKKKHRECAPGLLVAESRALTKARVEFDNEHKSAALQEIREALTD